MKSAFCNLNGNHHRTDIGLLLCGSGLLVNKRSSTLLHHGKRRSRKGRRYQGKTQIFSTVVSLILAVVISLFDYLKKKFVRLWFLYAPVALFLSMLVFTSGLSA